MQLSRFVGPDEFNFFAENECSWWAEVRVQSICSEYWRNTNKMRTHGVRAIVCLEHIVARRIVGA